MRPLSRQLQRPHDRGSKAVAQPVTCPRGNGRPNGRFPPPARARGHRPVPALESELPSTPGVSPDGPAVLPASNFLLSFKAGNDKLLQLPKATRAAMKEHEHRLKVTVWDTRPQARRLKRCFSSPQLTT